MPAAREQSSAGVEVRFVLGGFLCVAGVIANLIGMLFSQVSFAFGVSSAKGNQTIFFWLILFFQASSAVIGFAIRMSNEFARLIVRLVVD